MMMGKRRSSAMKSWRTYAGAAVGALWRGEESAFVSRFG